MANSMRIPTARERGIGTTPVSNQVANVPQTADTFAPFRAAAEIGDQTSALVTRYVDRQRQQEINSEIQDGETEFLRANGQVLLDLNKLADLRGDGALDFYEKNIQRVREETLAKYSPEAARHLERIVDRHYASSLLQVGRIANERLVDHSKQSALNLSQELINQALQAQLPDGTPDWATRDEYLSSGRTAYLGMDVIPEAEREKLANAYTDLFHQRLREVDGANDPQYVLDNLTNGRYGVNPTQLAKWRTEMQELIQAKQREADVARNRLETERQRELDMEWQNKIIDLQQNLQTGKANLIDIVHLQHWVRDQGKRGWNSAAGNYSMLTNLYEHHQRDAIRLAELENAVSRGYVLNPAEIDRLWASNPPQTPEQQTNFFRSYGLPEHIVRDATGAANRQDAPKAIYYAGVLEDLRTRNPAARTALGPRELLFYTKLEQYKGLGTDPKKIVDEVYKQVYEIDPDRLKLAQEMWTEPSGYKEKTEAKIADTLTPRGLFKRAWESITQPPRYAEKKDRLNIEGNFPTPPREMLRDVRKYMEFFSNNITNDSDFTDAWNTSLEQVRGMGWGVTYLDDEPRFMIKPPEDFYDPNFLEEVFESDLQAIGYTTKKQPGTISGIWTPPGQAAPEPTHQRIYRWDLDYLKEELSEDRASKYPVYTVRVTLEGGKQDLLRGPNGLPVEWGGLSLKQEIDRRIDETKAENLRKGEILNWAGTGGIPRFAPN